MTGAIGSYVIIAAFDILGKLAIPGTASRTSLYEKGEKP